MREYQQYMLEYENAQKVAATVDMDPKQLVGYETFKEKLESVNTMRAILEEAGRTEQEGVGRTAEERELERLNQTSQIDAEQDAVQEKNLLSLIVNGTLACAEPTARPAGDCTGLSFGRSCSCHPQRRHAHLCRRGCAA